MAAIARLSGAREVRKFRYSPFARMATESVRVRDESRIGISPSPRRKSKMLNGVVWKCASEVFLNAATIFHYDVPAVVHHRMVANHFSGALATVGFDDYLNLHGFVSRINHRW